MYDMINILWGEICRNVCVKEGVNFHVWEIMILVIHILHI